MQIPSQLKIKQKVELLEMLIDFEASNKYEIDYPDGQQFLFAFEKSAFWWKFILTRQRACEIFMVDQNKKEQFRLKRNFYFFFSSYELYAGDELIGKIKRNFGILHTKYTISDAQGNALATLEGPIWRPWTFNIKDLDGQKIGLIGKKLSGLKELFTDSDNFSFDIDDSVQDENLRALVLAATFAVDYDNFERSGSTDMS
jgi:uncharacterized protein YxjI